MQGVGRRSYYMWQYKDRNVRLKQDVVLLMHRNMHIRLVVSTSSTNQHDNINNGYRWYIGLRKSLSILLT